MTWAATIGLDNVTGDICEGRMLLLLLINKPFPFVTLVLFGIVMVVALSGDEFWLCTATAAAGGVTSKGTCSEFSAKEHSIVCWV